MDLNSPEIFSDESTNTLKSSDSPFDLPLRIESLPSEKDLHKFLKCVERIIRTSVEYRFWISFITTALGNTKCKLTHEQMSETNIEIHHHPINLYTICKAVVNNKINAKELFCTFDIATEVIELHFQNKVGYIPLLSDLHNKFHEGFLDLPMELVSGEYKEILKDYSIDDEDLQRIHSLCGIKAKDVKSINWSKDDYPGINDLREAI